MTPSTLAIVERAKQLCAAASPGPWGYIHGYGFHSKGPKTLNFSDGPRGPDEDFVCASRTLIPELVAAIEAAEADNEKLRLLRGDGNHDSSVDWKGRAEKAERENEQWLMAASTSRSHNEMMSQERREFWERAELLALKSGEQAKLIQKLDADIAWAKNLFQWDGECRAEMVEKIREKWGEANSLRREVAELRTTMAVWKQGLEAILDGDCMNPEQVGPDGEAERCGQCKACIAGLTLNTQPASVWSHMERVEKLEYEHEQVGIFEEDYWKPECMGTIVNERNRDQVFKAHAAVKAAKEAHEKE